MKKLLMAAFAAVLIISGAAYAGDAGSMVKGKVVSVDMAGKNVVIDTSEGQKTIVIQEGATGFSDVKAGDNVEISCVDVEGKACAKEIKVIAVNQPSNTVFEGEVISVDPAGKTMVIKNDQGEQMTVKMQAPAAETLAPAPGGALRSRPVPMTELKPGERVRVDCFDSEGKFCATRVTVISPRAAAEKIDPCSSGTLYTGQITSIDPAGKAVVISTTAGPKTLYYQETTTGMPLTGAQVGSRVKAYCLDVEGKSCIRDITEAPAP